MFDLSYLNKSQNKTKRATNNFVPEFTVWHETATKSGNHFDTLNYNLINDGNRGSYNYLIARNGVIYHYIDEESFISWHGGVNSSYMGYLGWFINVNSIGVEFEGKNNGEPITNDQGSVAIYLMRYFKEKYGIPMTKKYNPTHKDIVAAIQPDYKSDPKGCDMNLLITAANCTEDDTIYIVNTNDSNIREKPQINAKIKTKKQKGFIFTSERTVLGSDINNNEVWVELKEGGFIHSSLVNKLDSVPNYQVFGGIDLNNQKFIQYLMNKYDYLNENDCNLLFNVLQYFKINNKLFLAMFDLNSSKSNNKSYLLFDETDFVAHNSCVSNLIHDLCIISDLQIQSLKELIDYIFKYRKDIQNNYVESLLKIINTIG